MKRIGLGYGAVVGAVLGLTACGGGTGSTGSTAPVMEITAANAAEVAESVMGVVNLLQDGQPLLGALFLFDELYAAGTKSSVRSAITRIVEEDTLQCSGGGFRRATVNDADSNGQMSAGDSFTLSFDRCTEGTDTLNGAVRYHLTRFDDESSMAVTIVFDNLRGTDGGDAVVMNGRWAVVASETVTGVTYRFETERFEGAVNGQSARLTDFTFEVVHIRTVDELRLSYAGTVYDSGLGGQLRYASTVPFSATSSGYLYQGDMVVSGKNGSKLRLTAGDCGTGALQMELMAAGSGAYGSPVCADSLIP